MKKLLILVLFLLIISSVYAEEIGLASMHVPAVDSNGNGVLTTVESEIVTGKGRVLLNVVPYTGLHTQNSERVAVAVAEEITGRDFSQYDVIFTFNTEAESIDGPSAGAAMTLTTIAALEGKPIRSHSSMTGTIQEGGAVGMVGGIIPKLDAAAEDGVTLFLIPSGSRWQAVPTTVIERPASGWEIKRTVLDYVDVFDYAEELGVQVFEVSTMNEVISILLDGEGVLANTIQLQEVTLEKATEYNFLQPLDQLGQKEIARAQTTLSVAQDLLAEHNADQALITEIASLLAASEHSLKRAIQANKNNYAYGAANFGFRSRIDSQLAQEILKTDGMTDAELDEYWVTTYAEVQNTVVSTITQFRNIELLVQDPGASAWAVAAEERLSSAILLADTLNSSDPKLYDAVIIYAWIEIANDFHTIAKQEQTGSRYDDDSFGPSAAQKITTIRANTTPIETPVRFDPQWMLRIAETQFDRKWYVAASQSADVYLSRAGADSEYEIIQNTNKKVAYVNGVIESIDVVDSVWGVAYRDYARFALYLAQEENNDALLKEALTFARQAESYAAITREIQALPSEAVLIDFEIEPDTAISVTVIVFLLAIGVASPLFKKMKAR